MRTQPANQLPPVSPGLSTRAQRRAARRSRLSATARADRRLSEIDNRFAAELLAAYLADAPDMDEYGNCVACGTPWEDDGQSDAFGYERRLVPGCNCVAVVQEVA